MNNSASLQSVEPVNNQDLILSYIRAVKEIKIKSQDKIDSLSSVVKERDLEIRQLRAELDSAKSNINKHNSEFKTFRSILTDLKSQASGDDLGLEAIYAPEIMSFRKEKEKFESLYWQENKNCKKFESRSIAMSAQIIERQRVIYKLESLLLEGENKRQMLESLLKAEEVKRSHAAPVVNKDSISGKIKDLLQYFQRRLQAS